MKNLIASSRFSYATRELRAGDSFLASDRDARMLVILGKARQAYGDVPASDPADGPRDEVPVRRGPGRPRKYPRD